MRTVLNAVSLDVAAGEYVAVIGDSGIGKSTLLNAIARALVGDPKLVLADEPTGNLDPENARQVLALLRAQVKERGAAAILATHSEAAAAGCDRRYRLSAEGLAPLG